MPRGGSGDCEAGELERYSDLVDCRAFREIQVSGYFKAFLAFTEGSSRMELPLAGWFF